MQSDAPDQAVPPPFALIPIIEALVRAYIPLTRGRPVQPPEGGWPVTSSPTHPQPGHMLTPATVALHREERRGPMFVLLLVAFQLGAEQGIRVRARDAARGS